MNIKQASEATGLPSKTIRYYETVGLANPCRSDNGYRVYSDQDIHNLKFLSVARGLGFPIVDCRQLLGLYEDKHRSSSEVKDLAKSHLHQINQKISELNLMHDTLSQLINACRGDDRPDCPIIEKLSSNQSKAPS